MSMEKRGVIEEGRTPPEENPAAIQGKPQEKTADKKDLESHPVKRAADAVADSTYASGK